MTASSAVGTKVHAQIPAPCRYPGEAEDLDALGGIATSPSVGVRKVEWKPYSPAGHKSPDILAIYSSIETPPGTSLLSRIGDWMQYLMRRYRSSVELRLRDYLTTRSMPLWILAHATTEWSAWVWVCLRADHS
jgi:hypothetical protein